ncbi:TPA: 50S ribosomal protein L25 [Candidatus Saccharibacteria bacterium]|nr:50S ribosomal protein L25 [Candidatus Saccharibacteria bacterium]HIO87697.1 50S ribosomal protein L25 [Candidatus Saccharibacteria bacterium]
MDDVTLSVSARSTKGSKFRQTSQDVPGVVYGKDQEPLTVSVPVNVLKKTFNLVGGSKVIDLKIEEQEPIKVLFQDVQHDPVSGEPIHFDMYAVTLGQKMRTEVPLHFEGEPAPVATGEAVLVTIKDMIEVEANPLDLPENITVNLESLTEIGQTISVGDLSVAGDVEIISDADEAVAKLDVPRAEEEPEETDGEEEAGDESEEGESSSEDESTDSSD